MCLAERAFRYRLTMWLLDMAEHVFDTAAARQLFGSTCIRDVLHEVGKTRDDFRAWKAAGYGSKS